MMGAIEESCGGCPTAIPSNGWVVAFMGIISLLGGFWFAVAALSGCILLCGMALLVAFRGRTGRPAPPVQEPPDPGIDPGPEPAQGSEASQGEAAGGFSLAVSLVTSLGLLPISTDPPPQDGAVPTGDPPDCGSHGTGFHGSGAHESPSHDFPANDSTPNDSGDSGGA